MIDTDILQKVLDEDIEIFTEEAIDNVFAYLRRVYRTSGGSFQCLMIPARDDREDGFIIHYRPHFERPDVSEMSTCPACGGVVASGIPHDCPRPN